MLKMIVVLSGVSIASCSRIYAKWWYPPYDTDDSPCRQLRSIIILSVYFVTFKADRRQGRLLQGLCFPRALGL